MKEIFLPVETSYALELDINGVNCWDHCDRLLIITFRLDIKFVCAKKHELNCVYLGKIIMSQKKI